MVKKKQSSDETHLQMDMPQLERTNVTLHLRRMCKWDPDHCRTREQYTLVCLCRQLECSDMKLSPIHSSQLQNTSLSPPNTFSISPAYRTDFHSTANNDRFQSIPLHPCTR